MKNDPIGNYDHMADVYAAAVDNQPIHVYYERPGTWSLLPKQLENLQVLDLGCGSGWYAEQLIKAGCQVTAIDVSARMVELTEQRLKGQGRVIQADLEKPLDFLAANTFDLVIAPLMIHYIQDWPAFMQEVARILKPQGLFIFSTGQPHNDLQIFKLNNYFTQQVVQDYWPSYNVHVRFYHHTLHDLTESLYHAGFLIERMIEPLPQEGLRQDPHLYQLITTQPWFLFVRAIKK